MIDHDVLERRYQRERRILQVLAGGFAVFPLLLGCTVVAMGLAAMGPLFGVPVPRPYEPSLDSSVRFLGANFLGMGLLVLWVLPRIESRIVPFRIFVATALVGAAARVLSHVLVGRPVPMIETLTGVETSALLLGLWQARVHKMFLKLGGGSSGAG
jgi:hypothetical protein